MRYNRYVIPLVCLVLLMLCGVVVYAQVTVETKPDGAGLIPELNRWRTAIGLRPLQEDIPQSMAAQFHANDMAARNYFAHIAPSPVLCDGVNVTEPPQRAYCFDRIGRGEDLGSGYQTAAEAVRGLIAHYPHCVDIMKPTFTHMGGGENNKIWAMTFDGQVQPETTVDINSFCGCTSNNASEANIQSCVTKHNEKFNNGQTPPTPPMEPLQYKLRFPADKNATYGQKGGQRAEYMDRFHKGPLTIRVVPVTGNPSGIVINLADKDFKEIPGATGTDSLTYTVTDFTELTFWFDSSKVAQGDTFYIEAIWQPADVVANETGAETGAETAVATAEPLTCSENRTGAEVVFTVTNNSTEAVTLGWLDLECQETVYATIAAGESFQQSTFDGHAWVVRNLAGDVLEHFVASQDTTSIVVDGVAAPEATENPSTEVTSACSATVATVDELIAAINKDNDEQQCPGADSIFLISDLQVTAAYEGGANAFPTITSPISISSMNRQIVRDANVPAFRFFYVDGVNVNNGTRGSLVLQDIKLNGGDAGDSMDGGAIFVDARDGGVSSLITRNVDFVNNKANGNGGAIMTLSMGGGTVDLVIEGGLFDGNSGGYGGAIYSGGFDGGNATASIVGTNFTNNTATAEGGAIYNNGLGQGGHAQMRLEDISFTGTQSPRNDVIHNNGRAGGDAVLTINKNEFSGSGITLGGQGLIFNQGTDGSATMSWPGHDAGDNTNVCVGLSDTSGDLEVIPCP